MSAQSTPIGMDISEAAEGRNQIFSQNMGRLQHFAYRAMNVHGLSNEEFIVVCIMVDSSWRWLVDAIMPGADWQPFRDRGENPTARGFVSLPEDLRGIIVAKLPEFDVCLSERPKEGTANCIVLDDSGGTVYEIQPVEMPT